MIFRRDFFFEAFPFLNGSRCTEVSTVVSEVKRLEISGWRGTGKILWYYPHLSSFFSLPAKKERELIVLWRLLLRLDLKIETEEGKKKKKKGGNPFSLVYNCEGFPFSSKELEWRCCVRICETDWPLLGTEISTFGSLSPLWVERKIK